LTKRRKIPFAKEVDSGSFSGRNELPLGPSKYKCIPLAIQFFFHAFIFVFEGACSPKKSGPACTRVFQGKPTYVQKTLCPCTYASEAKTSRVHPQNLGKKNKFKKKQLTPFNLHWNEMYVHWREREHEDIDVLVEEDLAAIIALKQCGLWKFFLCPFMRAQPKLLNALVDYWHPDAEAFMIKGQSLTPMTEDIYFLTGLSRKEEPVNL
jgi:hypothetical protein